jgi:hypothetical protein
MKWLQEAADQQYSEVSSRYPGVYLGEKEFLRRISAVLATAAKAPELEK